MNFLIQHFKALCLGALTILIFNLHLSGQTEFVYLDHTETGEEVVVKLTIKDHTDSIKGVKRDIDTAPNAIEHINTELGEVYIISDHSLKTENDIRFPLSEGKFYFIPFKLGRYAFSLEEAYPNTDEFILNFGNDNNNSNSVGGGDYVCCCGHPPCGDTGGNHMGCITKGTSAYLACKKANSKACPDAGCVGELILNPPHSYPHEGIIHERYPGGGIFLEAKGWAGFGFSE